VSKKILITGGTGMVGSAFNDLSTEHELVLVGSADYDLRQASDCRCMLADNQPDAIIHLAAKVGGVKGNSDYVADFFCDNMMINTNILQSAVEFKVPKVLSLLSTCIYPDNPIYPLTEDQIHNGEPHRSNFGYAYAKRMLEVQSRAIRSQYGLNYITAVPNNIYGPKDNFDLENGHVIPAMIRKFYEAKENNTDVVLWGSGQPLREFTHSIDIAKVLLFLLENYEAEPPINIGSTREISIKKVSEIISKEIGFTGKVLWDVTKPEGQLKKPSSNQKFLDICPNFCYTDLECGLRDSVSWFKNNYPNVRGL
jgi:GDP-L-fucose synthase